MISRFAKLSSVVLVLSLLGACAEEYGQKQAVGGILGGVGGAVAGAQFGSGRGNLAATAVGTLLGAYLGSEVGRSLDRADQMAASQAASRAHNAPVGQTISWNNPESGNFGSYTPMRDGRDQQGNLCREYQSTITVQGRTEKAFGTACRQADGSWRIVN